MMFHELKMGNGVLAQRDGFGIAFTRHAMVLFFFKGTYSSSMPTADHEFTYRSLIRATEARSSTHVGIPVIVQTQSLQ